MLTRMSEVTPVHDGLFDAEGLMGGSCAACGQRHFPLAGHCPWCGTPEPAPHRLSTDGRLWSWTVVSTAPPGYDGPLPFGFGVVELAADGLQVVTQLTEHDPARLHVGDAVRFTVAPVGDGVSSWAFMPVPS